MGPRLRYVLIMSSFPLVCSGGRKGRGAVSPNFIIFVRIMYEHLLLLLVAAVAAAAHEPQFYYRWLSPQLRGRQGYNPGYTPEFGSCGSGTTCADACGAAFQACNASTSLSLFCYDPAAGQTCCGNGSGRKCC